MRSALGWIIIAGSAVTLCFMVPRFFGGSDVLDDLPAVLVCVGLLVLGAGIKEDSRVAYGIAVLVLGAAAYCYYSPPF